MSNRKTAFIPFSWDMDFDESELTPEEIYGYPESELTAERLHAQEFMALNKHDDEMLNFFFNPIFSDRSEIRPRYLMDNRGDYLFAPGLLHWLYGPSETGKSFIALCASLETAGIYVSLEMGARQMGTRVRKMKYHPLDSERFIFPEFFPYAKHA